VTLSRVRLAAALVGLAGSSACEAPRPRTCEGEHIGTFSFRGEIVPEDGGCPFAPDGAIRFTATVAFPDGESALLCIENPEAEPLRGSRGGDHVSLSSETTVELPSCACEVRVTESVVGDIVRADGGSAAGFSGELRNSIDPADAGASCERDTSPDAAPRCGVPCTLRWQLTGS
jgi:hypothetical protein